MDTSINSVRKTLLSSCSDAVVTDIQSLELIISNDRKDKYLDFRRHGNTELFGFMPLVNTIFTDKIFIRGAQKVFTKGVRTPGRIYPFFGSNNSGLCISRKPDTVFTVIEEGIDYWILVCAVTYDSTLTERTNLFSKRSSPARSFEWNRDIPLGGGEPGWKRHFECIQNILYVGEGKQCDYPSNVLPIAVAKVQFSRRESIPSPSLHIVPKRPAPMEMGQVMLRIEELAAKPGEIVFNKLFMMGTTIYSRHTIDEEEWPGSLYFDDYSVFPSVFNSWIVKGKLSMEALLNRGNVKMKTKLFYDHSFKECSRPHPDHVYLNYYQVSPPKEEMVNMINRLVELERKDMVLFGCVPLLDHIGHMMCAAVPSGELANRLGLPTIPGGRFHLIQALPVTRGTWKNANDDIELASMSRTSLLSHGGDDNCSDDLVALSSDSDEEGDGDGSEGGEERLVPPSLPNSPAAGTAGWHTQHMGDWWMREEVRPPLPLSPTITLPALPSPSPYLPSSSPYLPSILSPPPSLHSPPSLLSPPSLSPPPLSSIPDRMVIQMDDIQIEETEETTIHPESSIVNQSEDPFSDSDLLAEGDDTSCLDDSDDGRIEEYGRMIEDMTINFGQPGENAELHDHERDEIEEEGRNIELCTSESEKNRSDEQPSPGDITDPPDESPNERMESHLYPSVVRVEEEEREEEREINALSPPPTVRPVREEALTQTGFRIPKIHRNRHSRTNALLEEVGLPIAEDTMEQEELVVWNREKKESPLQSLYRLPPSAMVIVVDNELLRQMKNGELTPLIKILNENASAEENRIVLVIHKELDPDDPKTHQQMRNINPLVVFVMKHSGETMSNSQVECCERVKGIRWSHNTMMVYLTPNINADLQKNIKLVELGFKIYNTIDLVSYWENKEFED